jgi:ketosteroid isomerase-like protein
MKFAIALLTAAVMTAASASAAGATEQKLIDIENAIAKAFTQKDTATLSANMADDWMIQDSSGRHDKAGMIADVKSGKMTMTTMTNHDMHVRVMGNTAFVQGMDTEKSSYAGKDTSGTYSWMDVFEDRNGKWLAVATQLTKSEK